MGLGGGPERAGDRQCGPSSRGSSQGRDEAATEVLNHHQHTQGDAPAEVLKAVREMQRTLLDQVAQVG